MPDPVAKSLKRCELFYNLPDEVIASLSEQVEPIALNKGEVLFKKGDPGDGLYILQEGWVKMVGSDQDGNEVIFNQEGPGAVFGEMAVIDKEPRSAGVIALNEVHLLKLSQQAFQEIMAQHPILGIELSRTMSQRLRLATTYIELAIEWSKEIAEGNYEFVEQQAQSEGATVYTTSRSDRERATRFLGTFFKMAADVRAREEHLKQELIELKVVIDQQRRKQDVEKFSNSEFFKNLRKKRQQSQDDAFDEKREKE